MLDPILEKAMREEINPIYADMIGTHSYERKLLFAEIDRLRAILDTEIKPSAPKPTICHKHG